MESHQRPGGCRKPCTVLSTARRVNFLSIIARLSKECKRFFSFFPDFFAGLFSVFQKSSPAFTHRCGRNRAVRAVSDICAVFKEKVIH